ncbi:MAG: 2-C-methyl-D-erythritol 4-phosphate cytidylyltransferase [Candidatus Omnitrophica bacterium]|nr:2-C-methyl-D-erythritol 4-phosphate cytidylyltransferase [Candidatus Omnitrophota bacterium]MBU4479148.1 2-C-methyl-D-erythritol 4-phosphate cytidylyltransferase [Candidatus Omnitrophota bacterium]MCG2702787.1 2-C-methyl-D-erythritol 4-phosphate cytidylyltransferase [Candidatus Omnitrophota bacterium]
MKNIVAIVPAAGSGKRLKLKQAKPYVCLDGKPLLAHTLQVLEKSRKIKAIIVVVEKMQLARARALVKKFGINKVTAIVAGGATRSESVLRALAAVAPDTEFVLIHDGARPFASVALIDRCIRAALRHKAVICAVPCAQTIKAVDKNLDVISTLERSVLWQVQTPQVFAYSLLTRAYEKYKKGKVSFFDDASLVEQLPYKVRVVPGTDTNIKITTLDDLKIARALLKRER